MASRHLLLSAFLLLSGLVALSPGAAACHDDPASNGDWTTGPQTRTEIVGVGTTSAGVYQAQRGSFCGQTYATYCAPETVTLTTLDTPDVRVLGEEIVPATSTPVAMERLRPACLAGLYGSNELGVYADDPVAGSVSAGTDTIVWPAGITVP